MVKDSSWVSPGSRWMRWKPTRFFFVGGDTAQYVADIELHYFISGAFAGVGHLQADGGRLVRGNDSGGDVEVGVLEGSVAQAVTEGVQCSVDARHVARGPRILTAVYL